MDESAVPWSVEGGAASAETIEVGTDERVRVRLRPEQVFEEPLAAGSVLEVRVEVGALGDGRVRFRCVFTDVGGESANVPGSATFVADGVGPTGGCVLPGPPAWRPRSALRR